MTLILQMQYELIEPQRLMVPEVFFGVLRKELYSSVLGSRLRNSTS